MNIVCAFPSNESSLTNGGAGVGAFEAFPSAWTVNVQVVGGSPGTAHGNGATGTNDAVAMATGAWGLKQTCTGTISRTASPGAAEVELLHRITKSEPNHATYIENDLTATVLNQVDVGPNQGDFGVIGGATVTELIAGDVIKGLINGSTLTTYINDVLQATATSAVTTGNPGIGFDNGDASQFVLNGFTATDGVANAVSGQRGVFPQWASRLGA